MGMIIERLSRRLLLAGLGYCLVHAETPSSTTHRGIVRYYKPGDAISIDIRPQVEVNKDGDSGETVSAIDAEPLRHKPYGVRRIPIGKGYSELTAPAAVSAII